MEPVELTAGGGTEWDTGIGTKLPAQPPKPIKVQHFALLGTSRAAQLLCEPGQQGRDVAALKQIIQHNPEPAGEDPALSYNTWA